MYNKEKSRLKINLQKEVGDHMMSIITLKSKSRTTISKRFQIFMNKLLTSGHKEEGKLRILRSYRIKLLHTYWKDILREAYQYTLTTQLLEVCNNLRLKANLLPFKSRKDFLLYCGISDLNESMPQSFKSNCLLHDPDYNISNYTDNIFKTLFYVPHSTEICYLDNKIESGLKEEAGFKPGICEEIDEIDLEKVIRKEMVPKPTKIDKDIWANDNNGDFGSVLIKKRFKEAYDYSGKTYDVLVYMFLVHNIFDLQYFMWKLNSTGKDIYSLENTVMSGQLFWTDEK
jgi:hypothetical protein